jgi:hypothetical protein
MENTKIMGVLFGDIIGGWRNFETFSIWRSLPVKIQPTDNQDDEQKWRMLSTKLEEWCTPPDKLFNRLNFSWLLSVRGKEIIED